jgi:site-specific DNA-cytosine methylase
MKLLEIFCGTKSISKIFEKNGWESYTVDIEKKYNPTECVNILDFQYTKFDKNYFNHLHFSPDCTYMSQMQQSWYNRLKGKGENKYIFTPEIHNEKLKDSDLLLIKVKEIIDYFNKSTFTIENPYHNKFNNIINRKILNYPYEIVDYCMYNYIVKKPTVFLNNFNLKLKKCNKLHFHTNWKLYNKVDSRYKIPEELCIEIFNQVNMQQCNNA